MFIAKDIFKLYLIPGVQIVYSISKKKVFFRISQCASQISGNITLDARSYETRSSEMGGV